MDTMQDTELSQALAPAASPNAEPAWGWGDRFCMPLFSPGTRVRMAGEWETVSHVGLRRQELAIYLVGRDLPVDPSRLELAATTFTTLRVPEAR
ncbi:MULTISPECIES: hypothetical protein [unclassified Acidovorax]|uniref:hypothetical protein n=3 Tax=Acidovorax TaxID=12916 RepID=UPI002882F66E|nr:MULTISPECIES: hypothetical protein [unclassified Acidovorax]